MFKKIRNVLFLGLFFLTVSTNAVANISTSFSPAVPTINEGEAVNLVLNLYINDTYGSFTGGSVTFRGGTIYNDWIPQSVNVSPGGSPETLTSRSMYYYDEGSYTGSATGNATASVGNYVWVQSGYTRSYSCGFFSTCHTYVDTSHYELQWSSISTEINKSASITVLNVAPTITNVQYDPYSTIGKDFNFSATGQDPGIYDVLTFSWDLDQDGIYDDFIGQAGSYRFSTAGSHTIGLQLSDGDGGFDYRSFEFLVNDPVSAPEPTTMLLLGLGLMGLAGTRRKLKN